MKGLALGALGMVAYIGLCMVPGEALWFDPGQPMFEDTVVGGDPVLKFNREIKRETTMRYAVFLRRDQDDDPACDAEGGPFTYLPAKSGVLVDGTLGKWAPSDPRCRQLPVGSYYGTVTWTITNPYRDLLPKALQPWLGGLMSLLPPKEIQRTIPTFTITASEASE